MSEHETHINTDTANQRADEFTEPSGGPTPTAAEEEAAERGAKGVDVDAVEKPYREMTEKGAHARGEGAIS